VTIDLRHRTRGLKIAALAVAIAAALPAGAYVPPASAILRRVAQRRDEVGLSSMQVQGTLVLSGAAASLARASGLAPGAAGSGEVSVPAAVFVKSPGRCRLELTTAGVAASERPSLSARGPRVAGHRGLEALPAAVALVEGVCALLAERGVGDRGLAQALTARGVALSEVALGRLDGRVAFVLGGLPREARPQAWIDKQSFQPIRLVARFGAATRDVRLLDFGAAVGGEGFPRAVEVWDGAQLEARFTAEKLTPNPRLPDAMF
jgi:hypothetical protein